ncbi:MAG TPA: hypothetical protein VH371_03370 [Candidatus Limnocylindrales bacterium]|jgi:hypothetical protein
MMRLVALTVSCAVVAALALNVIGFVRFPGGPLKEDPEGALLALDLPLGDQARNAVGLTSEAGVTPYTPVYVGVFLRPAAGLSATIEDMRLVGATSGIVLVDSLMARPGKPQSGIGAVAGEIGDALNNYESLPGTLAAESSGASRPAVAVTVATRPGEQSYEGVAVDYRMGPFTFSTIYGPSVTVCVQPLPDGVDCSIDDPLTPPDK